MKVKTRKILLNVSLMVLILPSCQEPWYNHYHDFEANVDMKLIDALYNEPRYSKFVQYVSQYGLDPILYSDESKTLFVPSNEAFEWLTTEDTTGFMDQIMSYHTSPTVFLSNNIQGSKKLLSTLGKYISITQIPGGFLMDGISVNFSSPLYLDGKFYELSTVAVPKPSIYGYMELYSPFLRKYIDSFDTLYLDKSLSIPLGYNEQGETIYDSVFLEYNLFEEDFFPISEEFRLRTATLLLFTQKQYDEAIDIMASDMGTDASNIPEQWQYEVFLPQMMKQSVFEGSLEYEEFIPELENIQGDTSYIDPDKIDPESKILCSNGLVYNYLDFRVPEELYLEQRRFEAENFVESLGLGRYVWNTEFVTVSSDITTEPVANETDLASNDTIVSVSFVFNYTGDYSIEFILDNIFPGDYVLEWRGNYRPSGIYKVYVNSVDVTNTSPMVVSGSFDTFSFRELILSVVSEEYYIPDGARNNSVDFLVKDIISEYGSVVIKIEYQGSGSQSNNGLSIDYLALTPYQN